MNRTYFTLLAACSCSILCAFEAKAAEIVVFGDSMSSVGSNGSFSNGPVWTDYLADRLGLQRPVASRDGGHSYAVGGAKTAIDGANVPSIRTQISQFLAENDPRDDQLFFVWGGGNDFFSGVDQQVSSDNTKENLQTLLNAGVRHLITGDLPSLSGTTEWLLDFNKALKKDLSELEEANGASISFVDVFDTYQQVKAAPADFGVTEPLENAAQNSSSGDGYVWWTRGHWTTEYHNFMAEVASAALGFPSNTRHVSGWQTIDRDRTWDDVGLATTATAEQSTDANSRSIAANAIDGDLNTKAATNRSSTDHWWEMRLTEPHVLERLEIHNADPSGKALTDFGGFRAEAFDAESRLVWHKDFVGSELPHGILESEIVSLSGPVIGESLRLSKLPPVGDGRRGTFSISEVELYTNAHSLTLEPDETWAFEINAARRSADALVVAGDLDLGGSNLMVNLIEGELEAGDRFDIIDAATITGSFNDFTLPPLPPSIQWHTSGLSVDGSLAVTIRGDFDNSGELDAADIDLLSSEIRDLSLDSLFDLTGDGRIDGADHGHWVVDLAGTRFGDADLDGKVEFDDFLALSDGFGESDGWSHGDFDGNGNVEFDDFLILAQNFSTPTPAASAVPEPSAGLQLVSGMVALACWRNGRRRFDVKQP